MFILFSNCAKEEWQITHMCWLLKIECLNKKDPFPLPFLDLVSRHEMHSFINSYSGYNQVKISKEYIKKDNIHFGLGCICI
jgi:hypothetical protein